MKRTHTVPNIGASVRRIARVTGRPCTDRCADLYPVLLRQLIGTQRTSIFAVLDVELRQTFSLDNGMSVQDTLDMWLRRYRTPRVPVLGDPLCVLKKHREPLSVIWEGRDIRIWTWPGNLREVVANVTQRILNAVNLTGRRGRNVHQDDKEASEDEDFPHGCIDDQHRWGCLEEVCIPCTRRFAVELLDTYKCIDLVDIRDGQPLFGDTIRRSSLIRS